jgi:multidrug resistance efflux pump
VNPGNNVQVGQSLMAIRSLSDIWVDANFKETQLRDLRIGQRAELKVDISPWQVVWPRVVVIAACLGPLAYSCDFIRFKIHKLKQTV